MEKKKYIGKEREIPKMPRSRVLRERLRGGASVLTREGVGASDGGGASASADGHSHWNKGVLDKLSESDGYMTLDGEKIKAGYADRAKDADRADRADVADTAAMAEMAKDLTEDSPVNDRFVFKKKDDTVEGALTMEQVLTVLAGIDGKTWDTDSEGNARLLSLLIAQAWGIDASGLGRLRKLISDALEGTTYTGENLLTDKGYRIWTDERGEGRATVDYLSVRKKFTAMILEIMEKQYSGGDWVFGCAGCKIDKVVAYGMDGEPVAQEGTDGYRHKEDPLITGIIDRHADYLTLLADAPVLTVRKFLDNELKGILTVMRTGATGDSLKDWKESFEECRTGDAYTVWDDDEDEYVLTGSGWVNSYFAKAVPVKWYRCYFRSKDGKRTIGNKWQQGDQALCQTLNLIKSNGASENRRYWRTVTGTDLKHQDGTTAREYEQDGVRLDDGETYHYIDLSNEERVSVVRRPDGTATETDGYDTSDGTEKTRPKSHGSGRYQEVEYIESNGSQWIDTGVRARSGLKTEITFAIVAAADRCLLGRSENSQRLFYIAHGSSFYSYMGYGNYYMNYNKKLAAGTWYTAKSGLKAGEQYLRIYSADGTLYTSQSKALTDEYGFEGNVLLFNRQEGGSGASDRVSMLKIMDWEENVLRDFVAVVDTQTGEYGLWDKVEGRFYGSGGGDNFAAGAEVEESYLSTDAPRVDDSLCQVGNKWDTARQSMQQIVVAGQNAPAYEMYAGIDSFSLKDKWVMTAGRGGVRVRTDYLQLWSDANTAGGVVITWLGVWDDGRIYHKNEGVTWNGSMWVCRQESQGQEPGTDEDFWEEWVSAGRDGKDGKDGKATNIKGVADGRGDDSTDAMTIALGSDKGSGIVLLDDPDGTGTKAVKWLKKLPTEGNPNPLPVLRALAVELNDMYIYDGKAYIWNGDLWEDHGEWNVKGADGRDGELMYLEPDTIILEQTYSRNGDGGLEFAWRQAKATTVRYIKGGVEQDIDSVKLEWMENEQGSVWTCLYRIEGSTIVITRPTTTNYKSGQVCKARVTAKSGDYEQEMVLTVAVNYMGSYHGEVIGDVRREIANRTAFALDDEGQLLLNDYTRDLFSSAEEWRQWVAKTNASNATTGTLVRQTGDAWYVGYYESDSDDTTEKASLTISKRGATFVGTVESRGGGWQLNQDGSGHVGNGGIAWERNGDVSVGGRITGMLMRKATRITSLNYTKYMEKEALSGGWWIDVMKTGSYIVLDKSLNNVSELKQKGVGLPLPCLPFDKGEYDTQAEYDAAADAVREYVGAKVMVYNYSSVVCDIETYLEPYIVMIRDGKYERMTSEIVSSKGIGERQYVSMECVCRSGKAANQDGYRDAELIVWDVYTADMSRDGDKEDLLISFQA